MELEELALSFLLLILLGSPCSLLFSYIFLGSPLYLVENKYSQNLQMTVYDYFKVKTSRLKLCINLCTPEKLAVTVLSEAVESTHEA